MDTLEYQFNEMMKRQGVDVILNNTTTINAFFKEINDNKGMDDYKYMFANVGNVKEGDIIQYHNKEWIVINVQDNHSNVYNQVVIRRANSTVKMYIDNILYEFPTILDTKTFSIDTGDFFNIADGKIVVTLKDSPKARKIKHDKRFIVMQQAWKVIGFDWSKEGLVILTCEKDSFNSNDDIENEIADKWLYEQKHSYNISIVNGEIANVNVGDTLQLNAKITDNGQVIELPVTYISNDETIATVDSNGLITAIAKGTCSIQISLQADTNIIDTITITCMEQQAIPSSVQIIGNTSIVMMDETIYTAKVLDSNGNLIDGDLVWTVSDSDLVELSSNGNSCTLYANDTGSVVLRCELVEDTNIFDEININIDMW